MDIRRAPAPRAQPGGQHILVLGGTGALRPAVLRLCRAGATVGVVSRRPGRVSALAGECAPAAGEVYGIAADYQQADDLSEALSGAVSVRLPFTAALLYCPGITGRPLAAVGPVVHGRVVLLLTSQWAAPGRAPGRPGFPAVGGADPGRVTYLVLGWKRTAVGSSWHSPQEISAAALRALREEADACLGSTRPWSERPG